MSSAFVDLFWSHPAGEISRFFFFFFSVCLIVNHFKGSCYTVHEITSYVLMHISSRGVPMEASYMFFVS